MNKDMIATRYSLLDSGITTTRGYDYKLYIPVILLCMLFLCGAAYPEKWKITAYCSCQKCCGPKANGITASNRNLTWGMAACNWLKFGTKVNIKGIGTYIIEDRGAKSLFGDADHHIKHIDIYVPTHSAAKNFGVKYAEVEIL